MLSMKTLGEIFRAKRNEKHITLQDAASATRIRLGYLQKLEQGDYVGFPTPTITKGFIRIYARFLGLDEYDALAFYRREFSEIQSKTEKPVFYPESSLRKEPRWRLTAPVLIAGLVFIAIVFSVGYLVYQYMKFAGAPRVEIFTPKDGLIVNTENINIEGKVYAPARLTLNNTALRISSDGYFTKELQLNSGVNVLTFVAVGESGRSTTIKRIVRYDPE